MSKICFGLLLSGFALLAGPAHAQLYKVTDGVTVRDRRDRAALKVQVDGSEATTRSFWQDFMKDTYSIRFKSGLLATLGAGKKEELVAQQVTGLGIATKPVDLYANLSAVNDSTTEVAFFGGYGDKTYFESPSTSAEFRTLRPMLEKFATAARANAYQVHVKEAEANLAAAEKEQDKLQRSLQSAQSNTAANLKRIDELTSKNRANAQQMHQDSTQLTTNAQLRELSRQRLQRRRERLADAGRN